MFIILKPTVYVSVNEKDLINGIKCVYLKIKITIVEYTVIQKLYVSNTVVTLAHICITSFTEISVVVRIFV